MSPRDRPVQHLLIDRAALDHCRLAYHNTAQELLELCAKQQIHVMLLDDEGLRTIQHVRDFDVSNINADLTADNCQRIILTALRANESCECQARGCVRDALLSSIDGDDHITVFIKDETNLCLAKLADRIFVIGVLQRMCAQNHLPHHPVRQWFDCQRILSTQSKHTKDQRRQARLLRMEASKTE